MNPIPKWKIWLSYLWDIHIESRSSEYNPQLIIELSKGRYQLCTESAIYSHEDLYKNFAEVLAQTLNLKKAEVQNVLVLGLGLGSIPIILDQINPGTWNITAVEIDEEVAALANEYAFDKISSTIDTIITDAAIYIQMAQEESFDLICVDLFIGENTPQKFKTVSFLKSLHNMLTPKGIIIYNTLAFTKKDKEISQMFFDETFKVVFPAGQKVDAHRNYMLINNKDWFRT